MAHKDNSQKTRKAGKLSKKAIRAALKSAALLAERHRDIIKPEKLGPDDMLVTIMDNWHDILTDFPVLTVDQAKGCAACSACAICLIDGPLPDFEISGIAGLAGLA